MSSLAPSLAAYQDALEAAVTLSVPVFTIVLSVNGDSDSAFSHLTE
jgi:hypothetical protein